ncbi:hypothetical protein M1L60_01920 [Actinoplanes sp. TRM 88003]|uniref:beta-mannosidase n=1 Tax=Paractinoplanes aksuensis TaxID=2939490 RepID=A0ABT1DEU7_9ACTN|nr:hypothetical protein [Actinoplanes aksuensis]MCO8269343.1 hypothetical protein [Actinoplanes aksuensis]
MSKIEHHLDGRWTLTGPPGHIPATVPGCVHTDLLAAGKIVDPFLGENEKAVDWVGRANWMYERDIAWSGPRPDRIDLVFDGLDTVADIELDGVVLGSTRNMHRSYRFDVTDLLGDGLRPLRVRFTSAYTEAERMQSQLGPRPNAYPEPFNFVRKMACSFGWDWGPTLVTAGIWRGVRLEGWSTARLRSVKPLMTYAGERGHLNLSLALDRADPTSGARRPSAAARVSADATSGAREPSAAARVSADATSGAREPSAAARVSADATSGAREPSAAARVSADASSGARQPSTAACVSADATSGARDPSTTARVSADAIPGPQRPATTAESTANGPGIDAGVPLRVRVWLDDRELYDGPFVDAITLSDIDAEPWNPRGYGNAQLYDLTVVLLDGDVELDRWQRRAGFRTVDIDHTGGAFVFHVNETPVFVKGVNWIPDDIFPSRMTRDRYARRLGEAAAAGVNLVRVWGGGIYESRDFYELCDELGLMVWQDFPFACACYPEEEPLHSEVVAEARENVVRLASHPSLVAWNGNNENLWLYGADNWASRPGGDQSWGETYYLKTLPDIVSELDPTRPYMAGSPWSGSWEHEPNSPDHGTFHSWEVWNREDYLNYRDSAPRFVAEFGWQAPPAWRTLREAVTDEPMRPDSPGVLHHQKAIDGNGKLARGLADHFPEPRSTEAWHYLTQLNQVRAVRTGIAHWRSYWPHTAGTILWQLNDLWPVISWAAIDGAGRRKPLYFEMRSLYADRTLTIQPRPDGLAVAVMNDHSDLWTDIVRVARMDSQGVESAVFETAIEVPPRSNVLIPVPSHLTTTDQNPSDVLVAQVLTPRSHPDSSRLSDSSTDVIPPRGTAITRSAGRPSGDVEAASSWAAGSRSTGGPAGGVRDLWFFQDYHREDPGLTVTVEAVLEGLDVTVRSAGLARDVLLQPDRIHPAATVDQGFVTLLPGEETTFRVRNAAGPGAALALDAGLIRAPWVLTDLATALR